MQLLEKFQLDVSDHPVYRDDLTTSDFHLFLELNYVGGQSFEKKEGLQINVKAHLTSLAATFFEDGIPGLPISQIPESSRRLCRKVIILVHNFS
ncbi:hypothetical protein AVEN_268159-1 [Araneus ventricosus]|uniref:Uncharacterized protein n=1 Tax=Araneus ventricosus TaxID=182803 RepID=A0A4Y2LV51_ARAVE|nr:hypothetical protein AVEN_268159-1 [Araneus ventricosus]